MIFPLKTCEAPYVTYCHLLLTLLLLCIDYITTVTQFSLHNQQIGNSTQYANGTYPLSHSMCFHVKHMPICLSIRTNAHPDVNKFPRIVILIAMSQSQMIDINLLHNLTTNYKRTHQCGCGRLAKEKKEQKFHSNLTLPTI